MMLEYLESFHKDQISHIVLADTIKDITFRALPVDLSVLKQNNLELFKLISYRINIWNQQPKWTEALTEAQGRFIKANLKNNTCDYTLLKENFPVCFQNYPEVFNVERIYNQVWQMIQVKGNVFRSKERGKMEITREYKCRKCKNAKLIYADRITEFHFNVPDRCIVTKDCKGTMFDTETSKDNKEANLDHVIEYQEIKIQICERPVASELITVELQDEFVESCFVGDRVTISGTLELRSVKGVNDHRLVIRACSVIVEESQHKLNIDPTEMKFNIMCDWDNDLRRLNGDETRIKDEMVMATAPELKDLATVKLGLLMILCSGGKSTVTTEKLQAANKSITEREICHLLMVGDPGLGKSKILKAAAEISTNAVRTVGYAATTAGLAAHCIIEGGESHVEAGALVKANNGICCIDELNYLTKEHQGSIHEAMESQKISMSKAGLHVDLPTKCSIIAGMNQKNSNLPNDAGNMPIKQSLMSRFDLVFEFENLRDKEVNAAIARHILDRLDKDEELSEWNHERLQMHIEIAKEIRVEISEDATEILKKYFIFCRDCKEIEQSRRTYRLWTSLNNLTVCHAKLMLRSKAGIDDAVAVVMLMESTWTFGNLVRVPTVVQSKIPLGPSRAMTATILDKLDLCDLLEKKLSQGMKKSQKCSEKNAPMDKTIVDDIFGDDEDEENIPNDEVLLTQDIFSTQNNNNFPVKSSPFSFPRSPSTSKPEKSPYVPIDESPKFTSTQFSVKQTPERMDEGKSLNHTSNQKVSESLEDKLYAELNLMFSAKPAEKPVVISKKDFFPPSSSPRKTTSNLSPSSSFQNKLKKFKHSEDLSQNSEKLPEKIPEIENKSPTTVVEKRTLQDMEREVEEMDFFDF